jgi:hypothetical protein
MDSRPPLRKCRARRRVSQDPRFVCRHAPSPLTPGSPMRACARCFRIGGRLQHLRKIGRCHWFHEAESGSLALGSRLRSSRPSLVVRPAAIARPDRPVSRSQLPFYAGPELHGERAIHMADTSQSARQIRVTLAHRRQRRRVRRVLGIDIIMSGGRAAPPPCRRRAGQSFPLPPLASLLRVEIRCLRRLPHR